MPVDARLLAGLLCTVAMGWSSPVNAGAVRAPETFVGEGLGPNDDDTSGALELGFVVRFAREDVRQLFVSNNGYVALSRPGGEQFTSTTFRQRLIAPFFADVDTRGEGSGTVRWGQGQVDGRAAFAVTWYRVGYFRAHSDRLNTFQLVLVERSDVGPGAFDLEMNYDAIAWDCGDSECAGEGQGTAAAVVGWSDGTVDTMITGSGEPGTFLDSSATGGLVLGRLGTLVPGRYVHPFHAPDGPLVTDGSVNEPGPSPVSRRGCADDAPLNAQSRTPLGAALGAALLVLILGAVRARG